MYQIFYPSGIVKQINTEAKYRDGIGLTADGRFLATVKTETVMHIWATLSDDAANRAQQLTAGFEKYDGMLHISWMPDGRIIFDAFQAEASSIRTVDIGGENSEQIATVVGGPETISPDGRYLVYQKSDLEHPTSTWRMDLRDGSEKQLTKSAADVWATFSPDRKWIVFTRFSERVGLWKIPSEGGEPTLVLDENAICPAISPDGKTVAFVWRQGGAANRIALVSIDGGEVIKSFDVKLEYNPIFNKQNLQWTKDGLGIYFVALNDNVSNIWQQPIDGSPPVPVTNFKTGRIFNFAFSPDGSQLALSRGTINSDVVLIENAR